MLARGRAFHRPAAAPRLVSAAATAARGTAAATAADCTAAREGVETLRVELDGHVRRTEALLAETRSRLEAAEAAIQRQPGPTPRSATPAPAATTVSDSAAATSSARSASAQHRRAALGLMAPSAGGAAAASAPTPPSAPMVAPPTQQPASDIHVQLSCTRSDLQALSQEVGAIVALLEAGDVDVRTLATTAQRALHNAVGTSEPPGAPHPKVAEASASTSHDTSIATAPMHVSATTAVTSLRSTVVTLQERLYELERVVEQLRLEVSASRAEAVETRDTLLRCAAAGRQADGSIRSLGDRTSELEAAFRVLAPMAMQQHQQQQRAASAWTRGGAGHAASPAPADVAAPAAPAATSPPRPGYSSGSGAVQLSSVPAAPPQPPASAAEHAASSRTAPTTQPLSPLSTASGALTSPGLHLSAISAAVAHLPTAVDLPLRQRYSLLGGGGGPELSALLPTAAPLSTRSHGGTAIGSDPIVAEDASSMPKWRDTHAPRAAASAGAAGTGSRSGSRASSPPAARHAGLPVTLHGRGW